MRGRKPRPLSISPMDLPSLQHIARCDSLPGFQVRQARIVLANAQVVRSSTIAFQMQRHESTVWRTCRCYEQHGLTGLLAPPCRSGRTERISPLQRTQIVALACLEPVARGLHITHWSSEDLARQAVLDGIVSAITPPLLDHQCSLTGGPVFGVHYTPAGPATGGLPGSMPGSSSGPRRCSGATPTPSGWPGRASGPSAPMRCLTSRCSNGTRSAGPSPARSSSRSSSTPGTARGGSRGARRCPEVRGCCGR